ncbi:hypothetical protein D1872_338750 [compost metagenome]
MVRPEKPMPAQQIAIFAKGFGNNNFFAGYKAKGSITIVAFAIHHLGNIYDV